MRPATLAIGFGVGRALVGVALLATPGPIARAWVGSDGAAANVLSRSLGVRDLVLGAGVAVAAARDRDPTMWLAGGVLADAVDGIATFTGGEDIPRNGRAGTTALAGASALFGAYLASAID
jgi:hypothetical protein